MLEFNEFKYLERRRLSEVIDWVWKRLDLKESLETMSDALIKLFQDPNESENFENDNDNDEGTAHAPVCQRTYRSPPGTTAVRFPPLTSLQVKIAKVRSSRDQWGKPFN